MPEVGPEKGDIAVHEANPCLGILYQLHVMIVSLKELFFERIWREEINHAQKYGQ
jgi:hypothetical protein